MKISRKLLILFVVILFGCNGCASNQKQIDQDETNPTVVLELYSEKNVISSTSSPLKVHLINQSGQDIVTGESYSIERFRKNEWTEIPLSLMFDDIAYMISAGDERNFVCIIEDISEDGLYRIKKPYSVDGENASSKKYAYAEFQIEADK